MNVNIYEIIFHANFRNARILQYYIQLFHEILIFKNIISILKLLTKIFLSGRQIYRNKMEYMRKYSNLFLWWWTFACIYGVLHWCANPLVLGWSPDEIDSINHTVKNRNLPFFIWNPVNIDNIYAYACMYVMQTIGGLSSALGIICYDTFYVTILMIICVQFQYINIIITKIEFKYELCYWLFVN